MAQKKIQKKNLSKFIAASRENARFYGPVRTDEGVSLVECEPDDELVLEYSNFKLPPKRLFFPPSEVICTCEAQAMTDVPLPGDEVVIFGVRPCDASSLLCLDEVFLDEEFNDPYYQRRRDNALIISLACHEPPATCFCTSVGGSPSSGEGSDILAFDLGDSLLFEGLTEKGNTCIASLADILEDATEQDVAATNEQAQAAETKVLPVGVSGVTEKLQGEFDSPLWDEAAESCLSCGACTYLCPTCHCFTLYDEVAGEKGRRMRAHDCCAYPFFSVEASGHNPRDAGGPRMRQRIMHKFLYTVENFDRIFCVGCGRCVLNCPVNSDIRETIAEAMQ